VEQGQFVDADDQEGSDYAEAIQKLHDCRCSRVWTKTNIARVWTATGKHS